MSAPTYNEPLLTCYAMRYPDLMAGYCFGVPSMCNFGALLTHWKEHGIQGAPLTRIGPAPRRSPPTEPRDHCTACTEGRIRACISDDVKLSLIHI